MFFCKNESNLPFRFTFKVIFSPYEKSGIEIIDGGYKVAASVDARNIIDYAGNETFDKGDYTVTYYITTDLSDKNDSDWKYVDKIEMYPLKRFVPSSRK